MTKKILVSILSIAFIVTIGFSISSCSNENKDVSANQNLSVNKSEIVLDNIFARKSVRSFTGEKMKKEDLTTLMRAGMAAPSARNSQPWQLVAVNDIELLKKLEEALPYAKMTVNAGQGIVVCGDSTLFLPAPSNEFWIQDCSAVTQNILLAAEAMGFGAVWTGAYPDTARSRAIQKILNLPKHIIPLCYIPIGYPTEGIKPKDKFKEEKIHWNGWALN